MEEVLSKKIRILSFHNACNFGAILQAYGLQQTILSMGYDNVMFIKYNPKYLQDRYNPFANENLYHNKSLKGFIIWCLHYPVFASSILFRNYKLRHSIKDLLLQTSRQIEDESGLKTEEADVLICGSDQIWNTSLTGEYDPVFMGEGPYKYLGRAVAYAPSTELSALTDEKALLLCKLIENFSHLSVREVQVKERLQKYISKDIQICVDPSILCGSEAYNRIASPRLEKKEYIVVYAYNYNDPIIVRLIKSIPNYNNYKIHIILLGEKNLKNAFVRNIHSAITVQDFLSYMKYASYVVTNSFHGLAFSLLFEKNFNVGYCEGKNIRCLSLLQQLGLEYRCSDNDNKIFWDKLDYNYINNKLGELRAESRAFLLNAIKG